MAVDIWALGNYNANCVACPYERKVDEMSRLKYDYRTKCVSIRVSYQLFALLRKMCHETGISRQDYITDCLLYFLDPTEVLCPDWRVLPPELRGEMYKIDLLPEDDPNNDKWPF